MQLATESRINQTSMQQILLFYKYYQYKILFVQELNEDDYDWLWLILPLLWNHLWNDNWQYNFTVYLLLGWMNIFPYVKVFYNYWYRLGENYNISTSQKVKCIDNRLENEKRCDENQIMFQQQLVCVWQLLDETFPGWWIEWPTWLLDSFCGVI